MLCFKISSSAKQSLDLLLERYGYSNYSDAVNAAIINQVALHEQMGGNDSLFIEDITAPQRSSASPKTTEIGEGDRGGRERESKVSSQGELITERISDSQRAVPRKRPAGSGLEKELPRQLARPAKPPSKREVAPLPTDMWAANEAVPATRWIFGQYNKILPLKIACRGVASAVLAKGNGVRIEDINYVVAQHASQVAERLLYFDQVAGRKRDDAWATAFPAPDPGGNAKAQMRFASQFVGAVDKSDRLSGLPFMLKLINFIGPSKDRISLTNPGWEFAVLDSPILDGQIDEPKDKLTLEERLFLIRHIINNVPVEHSNYMQILRLVAEGANTPTDLDQALSRSIPSEEKGRATQSFIRTQRSGAISRMCDLGVLQREREGTGMTYCFGSNTGELMKDSQEVA